MVVSCAGALPNPIGMQVPWQSALPATAGAHSGFLWLHYYIPQAAAPVRPSHPIERSYAWIAVALAVSLAFIMTLGRGIHLDR